MGTAERPKHARCTCHRLANDSDSKITVPMHQDLCRCRVYTLTYGTDDLVFALIRAFAAVHSYLRGHIDSRISSTLTLVGGDRMTIAAVQYGLSLTYRLSIDLVFIPLQGA